MEGSLTSWELLDNEILSMKSDMPWGPNQRPKKRRSLRVCIIGAGAAGLYAAMIFDSLNIPGLTYELLEASNRVGGRMFTHRFSDEIFDYADMGAMRYPKTPTMQRVFDLFERLNLPLVDYHFSNEKCPNLFNGLQCNSESAEDSDPYHFGVKNGGIAPDHLVALGAGTVLGNAFKPWLHLLEEDFNRNFPKLLQLDHYSVRQFLESELGYDKGTINWLETVSSASGLFEESFVEAVLDDFHLANTKSWVCIEGGGIVLIDRMLEQICNKPIMEKRVNLIEQKPDGLLVSAEDQLRQTYDAVLSSVPLPCLQKVDLSKLDLLPEHRAAIANLHYDRSVKVAIKFDRPWWFTDCALTCGGSSVTDLPLRECIYPSYGLEREGSKTSILMASYTWADDAERIGRLVKDTSPDGEDELRDMLLHDLAKIHQKYISEEQLRESYVTHFSYDWSRDPNAGRAFALCSPGQFGSLYPSLTVPGADGRFYFIGEAATIYHAWLLGSFDSVYRSIFQLLERFGYSDERAKLHQLWGTTDSSPEMGQPVRM